MRVLICTLTLLYMALNCYGWGSSDKVKLIDLKTITLYNGRMTSGRRSSPVPQLKCVGGSADCYSFVPQVIQCYNKGHDGNDVQWKCETDMDNAYRFGTVTVSCEGYDYPNDPYVLKGSCGLEYTIDYTKEGHQQQSGQHNYYGKGAGTSYPYYKKYSGYGDVIILIMIGGVIYFLYKTCLANQMNRGGGDDDDQYPRQNRSWFGGGGGAPPPGFRPEYYDNNASCGSNNRGTGQGGGGFWTGAFTGGILGYMMGNRGNQTYYQTPYHAPRTSWFGGGSSSGYSSFPSTSGSSGSTGTRSASGYGGTSRR